MLDFLLTILGYCDDATVIGCFTAIFSNAIIASMIALCAWVGSRVYQRPSLWHAIWVIALVKLFIPSIWTIPVANIVQSRIAQTSSITSSIGSSPKGFAPHDLPSFSAIGVSNTSRSAELGASGTVVVDPSRPEVSFATCIVLIALCVWILVGLAILVVSGSRIIRFHRMLRRSRVTDSDTSDLAESMAKAVIGSRKRPLVYLVEQSVSPLLWPIGRSPAIVLPLSWWQMTTHEERQTVLMHELVHWRRKDHWIRLLHWVATIAFWWHPLVWIARAELHRLEEECCDAEVMYRIPGAGRAYASALLSASNWLNATVQPKFLALQPSPVAMRMCDVKQFKSFLRRIEMLSTRCYRPWSRSHMAGVIATAIFLLATGMSITSSKTSAQQPEIGQSTTEKESTKQTAELVQNSGSVASVSNTSTLVGTINDMDGKPIRDAEVQVVVPSGDLRFPVNKESHRQFSGTTDATGAFSIAVSGVEKATLASIDIVHKGHRRLVGTLMAGGDPNEVTLVPGGRAEFDAKLPASLYFAGQIVDEKGVPIEGVTVRSSHCTKGGTGGIEVTMSDKEGRFAIYSYEEAWMQDIVESKAPTLQVHFQNDRYMDASLKDLLSIAPSEREKLKVVMESGFSFGGIVTESSGGKPATDVVVSLTQSESYQRKAVRTDSNGRFQFRGIGPGSATLRIVDVAKRLKFIKQVMVESSNDDMKVVLQAIEPLTSTTYKVLGMTLADVTSAMDDAYDLRQKETKGVMVVDPGANVERFAIGDLQPGYVFWMVGNDKITDTKAMVSQLVKEAKSPTIPLGSLGNMSATIDGNGALVRVVYTMDNEDSYATNTQYMRLTEDDISELVRLNDILGRE